MSESRSLSGIPGTRPCSLKNLRITLSRISDNTRRPEGFKGEGEPESWIGFYLNASQLDMTSRRGKGPLPRRDSHQTAPIGKNRRRKRSLRTFSQRPDRCSAGSTFLTPHSRRPLDPLIRSALDAQVSAQPPGCGEHRLDFEFSLTQLHADRVAIWEQQILVNLDSLRVEDQAGSEPAQHFAGQDFRDEPAGLCAVQHDWHSPFGKQ